MAKQVVARMQGDDYQVRYFWLRALELITSDHVEMVELESPSIGVVDDVVVAYKSPGKRDNGGFYKTDWCQLKYHVTRGGAFTPAALLDPSFTHTKEPLLVRLYDAYRKLGSRQDPFRLRVISPWCWDPADLLAGCLATEGHFRDDFFDARPRTRVGQGRTRLAQALGIADAEFCAFFRLVRFDLGARTLCTMNEHLSACLKLAGLKPLPPDHLHSPYDDLARKFLGAGLTRFTPASLTALLREENLFEPSIPRRSQITLRSRPQWAKKPLDTQSAHLDLCDFFDERFPSHPDAWSERIPEALREFLSPERLGDLPQPIEVFFDCHLSIAFAAGSLLSSRCGLQLVPAQKSSGKGYESWECPTVVEPGAWSVDPPDPPASAEVAVAVSVTHDVSKHVRAYAAHRGLDHLPVLAFAPRCGIGPLTVRDACHAWSLGAGFSAHLHPLLPAKCAGIHLFYAGPAALAFIIGANLGGLPPIQLYEHDFEGLSLEERYYPALALPLGRRSVERV